MWAHAGAPLLAEAVANASYDHCLAIHRFLHAGTRHTCGDVGCASGLCEAGAAEGEVPAGVQFAAKRLFTADQLDWLEAYLAMYGDLGWPLTNKQIAARMTRMLKLQKRVGEHNQPIDVSAKYARKFVKSRPMLKAFKTSNIDPLRSKKATLQVSGFLIHFVP